ncbi:hypothetical protein [Bartonella raoultii]|uniref:Uncharacterized protein n=1 Tax=Bartonella raoultii TaxID=1457020 RepID=A0ABS7I6E5_9HYPH|nr:hypothetical protein [Bartonella raoultii]MBX4335157.1 hypothetical protein [Bartonella raoultii]
MTFFMSLSCSYADNQSFCLQVVKERDDALQKLNLVEFEKANAERGWNDAVKALGIMAEDLTRIAIEQQDVYLALVKTVPNNQKLRSMYEVTLKRNSEIFHRFQKILTIFEHVAKRTEAFQGLSEADKLKDKSKSLQHLQNITKYTGYIDALNKEITKLNQEIDALNNKLENLKKTSR